MPLASRYTKTRVFVNDSAYYAPLRQGRYSERRLIQFGTPVLRHPTATDRTFIATSTHIWSYGDRLSNLAYTAYGDPTLWWTLAWYNGVPTESHIAVGQAIQIPLKLEVLLANIGL